MPIMTLSSGARLNSSETGLGQPLVLIHGSPGDGRAWSRVTKHLPANTRLLAPDLPGYGDSDPLSPQTSERTEAMAAAIGELIEHCASPVRLCGHSYGANVALHAALRYPKHVKALALIEPVFMRALDLAGERAARVETEAFFTTYLVRVELAEPDAIGLMIDFWSGPGVYAKMSPRHKHFLNEAAARNADDVRASFCESITAAQLASFDRPVMIAYGSATALVARSIAMALAGLLPQAEVLAIPGATHAMLDSHPKETAAFIDRFCGNRVPAGLAAD
jgi:pimeloyl-ACP methyl ester carboxylesterase